MTTRTTKSQVGNDAGEEQIDCERDWTSLPKEVLELILSNFRVIDEVYKFRAVCKAWQLVHYFTDHMEFGSQWLAEKRRDEPILRLFHPSSAQVYTMDIPELCGASIRFSKNGWLLMSRGYREVFFFHPFTKYKIKLPKLPVGYDFTGITFTSNPTADDCVVFGISAVLGLYVHIYTISHGHKRWSETKINDDPNLYPSYCNPVYHKGKFYTLCKYGELGVFDSNGKWSVIDPQECLRYLYENYILDFNGELVSVFVARMGNCISVFKWDESASYWVSIDDLGEYMLFLSETTSFARKSLSEYMNNKIYFPRFNDKYGVFYDMKNESYQTFGNDFSREELYNTKLQLECSWIEPTKEIGAKLVDWFGNSFEGDHDIGAEESDNSEENSTGDDSSENSTNDDSKTDASDEDYDDSTSEEDYDDSTSEDSETDSETDASDEDYDDSTSEDTETDASDED